MKRVAWEHFPGCSLTKLHPLNMKTNMKRLAVGLRTSALAAALTAVLAPGALAAADSSYEANDLLLFFRNPNGTTNTTSIVVSSLGSTFDIFRGNPGTLDYGQQISLGNIGTLLTSTYGTDWSNPSGSLFVGAAGQNGAVAAVSTSVTSGDYARTLYLTQSRNGQGSFSFYNSTPISLATSQTAIAGSIAGANSPAGDLASTPGSLSSSAGGTGVQLANQNPISSQNIAGTAYGAIPSGIMGQVSSNTYSYGNVSDVVVGLDLWRVSPSTNGATAWQNVNNINRDYGGGASQSDWFLGTITLSSNGDVNFTAVPEPSTSTLVGLAAAALSFYCYRRRRKI